MSALLALLRKELYHIGRDRRTLAVIVLMPIVQVVLFGFAIRTDVKHVRLAIVDPTPDDETLALRQRFASTKDTFELAAVLSHTGGLEALFQRGAAQAAVVFEPRLCDPDGARAFRPGCCSWSMRPSRIPEAPIQGYVTAVVDAFARERGATAAVRIVPAVQMAFNPTRESKHLFVPGLMAFVLTIVSALMTAISLTREKETGTIEALLVSPLQPLADRGRQGAAVPGGRVHQRAGGRRRSAARLRRARCEAAWRCCSPRDCCSSWCRCRSAS